MAFCRLVFPLLVLSVICINATNVPVYMWNNLPRTSAKSNPLATLSTPEFEGILKQELANKPLTIVFIEETLSVEDFSLRTAEGVTAFSYLHGNVGKSVYLPAVEDALDALNEIADQSGSESDHITLTENGLSEEIAPKSDDSGKFVFVNLRDAVVGESRVDMLERHDKFMRDTLENFGKRGEKVVAIYTAHYPSWTIPVTHSRVRRAVTPRNENQTLYVMDGVRLYASSIIVTVGNETYQLKDLTSATSRSDETNMTITTVMTFSNASFTLVFNEKSGYWFFDNVTLTLPSEGEEQLYPVDEVFAIIGFSYRCKDTISFVSRNETKNYALTFKDMKIQPFLENSTAPFGDSFNCVGFFSAPIWAGLFVVFILLLITFYGIMMMMDIRTMDRFDDPKGKTITINAAE